MASLQAFPPSLLLRAWSRTLIPFPFPFERLPRRLSGTTFFACCQICVVLLIGHASWEI